MPLLLHPVSACVPPPRALLRRLPWLPSRRRFRAPSRSSPPWARSTSRRPPPTISTGSTSSRSSTPPPTPTRPLRREEELGAEEGMELELEFELHKVAEMERAWERARKAQHRLLRQRQVKAETEAWARAAEEYREIEREMLDRRLAPALPYVKSLFVGWFEPLRDAIARDQDVQRRKRVKHIYAKYLLLLPADKMAVILMHKMMGLLMSSKDGSGSVRVVQAAHCIGEAVEREMGAVAVNLVPGEKPADIYSEIAARVLDVVREDAMKDPATYPTASLARVLVDQLKTWALVAYRCIGSLSSRQL